MNNQNSILLIDSAFDSDLSIHCNLLVKISPDNFSYAIIHQDDNKVIAVFDEQECENGIKQLANRLKSDPYLAFTYNEVKVAVYTTNSIFVPAAFEDHQSENLHLSFFTQAPTTSLYRTKHPVFGFTTIFSLTQFTEDLLQQSLTASKKFQHSASLLKLAETITNAAILLDFTVGTVNILYVKDKKVVFQQYYEIENVEEFNYYLLLIINQLNILAKETTVYVSGIIDETDEKYDLLQKSFEAVSFLNPNQALLNQDVLSDMPAHYYTTLLALDQCAS